MTASRFLQMTVPEIRSKDYGLLLKDVRKTLVEGQRQIENERVRTYWETGRLIQTHILKNAGRAQYGAEVIGRLAEDLRINHTVLHRCVRFFQAYPRLPIVAGRQQFSWTHYRELMRIPDEGKRLRLEKMASDKKWSSDELALRIREDARGNIPSREAVETEQAAADHKPLIVNRGELYTYRLVERPQLSAGEGSGLMVDLGFGVYHDVDARLVSAFHKEDIVESRPKEDAYKFYRTQRTAKDLFTYRAVVEKVIDGDTVKVRFDLGFRVWTRQTLRLRGIDCPEAGTAAGDEAKNFVRLQLKESQRIIVRSSRSDKYDRYLADVFIPKGEEPDPETDVYLNNLLLETGRAVRM